MQKWKCHKVVEAARIAEIGVGGLVLVGEEPVYPTAEYFARHRPEVGGYYVKYADGYESYSPAAAFEQGYTPVTEVTQADLDAITDEPILRYFSFHHLPPHLARVSEWFAQVAGRCILELQRGPERSVALRKLLEGKDAAVRQALTDGPRESGR